jgi:hypothetical protein
VKHKEGEKHTKPTNKLFSLAHKLQSVDIWIV